MGSIQTPRYLNPEIQNKDNGLNFLENTKSRMKD